jgi:hypothetical protein
MLVIAVIVHWELWKRLERRFKDIFDVDCALSMIGLQAIVKRQSCLAEMIANERPYSRTLLVSP